MRATAARKLHSIETALTKVVNDLRLASDSGSGSILVLLHLSAAWWITFYYITQKVILVSLTLLSDKSLFYETTVHQTIRGSVVVYHRDLCSPLFFFSIYMLPLGTLIISFHLVSISVQTILSFTSLFSLMPVNSWWNWKNAYQKSTMTSSNSLLLNAEKTEMPHLGLKQIRNKFCDLTLTEHRWFHYLTKSWCPIRS